MSEDQFPNLLVQRTISAYQNGNISEEEAFFAISFATLLDDAEAETLLERCKVEGTANTLNAISL